MKESNLQLTDQEVVPGPNSHALRSPSRADLTQDRLIDGRLSAEEFGGVWHWHATEDSGAAHAAFERESAGRRPFSVVSPGNPRSSATPSCLRPTRSSTTAPAPARPHPSRPSLSDRLRRPGLHSTQCSLHSVVCSVVELSDSWTVRVDSGATWAVDCPVFCAHPPDRPARCMARDMAPKCAGQQPEPAPFKPPCGAWRGSRFPTWVEPRPCLTEVLDAVACGRTRAGSGRRAGP